MLRPSPGRLLLLLPTATYRATAFVEAARRLGVELTVASELPSTFEQVQPAGLVTLDFSDPERAAHIVECAGSAAGELRDSLGHLHRLAGGEGAGGFVEQ